MCRSFYIAPIVEGHGEVQAVPILLKRLLAETVPEAQLQLNPALRVKAGSFLNDGDYFNKYVELAAQKASSRANSCVLILLDCEDQCPGELGPAIWKRARACRSDVVIIVILAYREYETWFLAAARSLRGVCGLPADLEPPDNVEAIRNAKGWLSRQMNLSYNETNNQPRLTDVFSFHEAMAVHSFARTVRKLRQFFLLEATTNPNLE